MRRLGLAAGAAVLLAVGCNFPFDFDALRTNCDAGVCGPGGGIGGGGGGGIGGGGGGAGGGSGGGGGADGGAACIGASGWCWENPRPLGNTLYAVWAFGEDDVWIAGTGGSLLHWDGAAWRQEASLVGSVREFTAFEAFAPDDLWLGGVGGLFHFDGATWARVDVEPLDVYDLARTPAGRLLAGGYTGLFEIDPGTRVSAPVDLLDGGHAVLSVVPRAEGLVVTYSLTGPPYSFGVVAVDDAGVTGQDFGSAVVNRAWAGTLGRTFVGLESGILEWTGQPPAATRYTGLACYDGTTVGLTDYAVGQFGVLRGVDGGWVPEISGGVNAPELLGVHASAPDDVWAVGIGGAVVHRGQSGQWAERSAGARHGVLDLAFFPGGALAVGRSGLVLTSDGGGDWAPADQRYDTRGELVRAVHCAPGPQGHCYLVVRNEGLVSDQGHLAIPALVGFEALDVWAADDQRVFVVGPEASSPPRLKRLAWQPGGTMVGFELPVPDAGACAGATLQAIDGDADAGRALVVGTGGCLLELLLAPDGGVTVTDANPTFAIPASVDLNDVAFDADGAAWLAGAPGVVYRVAPGGATMDFPFAAADFLGVWPTASGVYAIALHDLYVLPSGGAWQRVALGTGDEISLHRVRGTAEGVWLVGDHGAILRKRLP